MRILFTTLLCMILAAGSAVAQESGELNVPLSTPGKKGKLSVDINKGTVTVKGTGRQDVLVRYKSLEGNDPKISDAGNGLKKISGGVTDLEVMEKGNTVYVESSSWNKGLELYIEVPQSFDLIIETYNQGDVLVQNVDGEHAIESQNGKITAQNIGGSLVADTYNGPIVASFTKVTPETPMAFSTYNGNIDLTFPAGVKANLKLKTQRGEIYTGFDVALKKQQPVPEKNNPSETYKVSLDGWITGTVNGGGPEIMMKNYNGDIFIRKG